MSEVSILMTGIGGQGIQLASRVLAQAASLDGRRVMHFGIYGGMIRGGPSDCTVVASTEEIVAPPIVDEAWALIAMHPGSLAALLPKIRPEGALLLNSTLVTGVTETRTVVAIPATRIAEEAGSAVGASMVAIGAFVEATGFCATESLIESMRLAIPPHRQALVELNRRCIELGRDWTRAAPPLPPDARAWGPSPAVRPAAFAS